MGGAVARHFPGLCILTWSQKCKDDYCIRLSFHSCSGGGGGGGYEDKQVNTINICPCIRRCNSSCNSRYNHKRKWLDQYIRRGLKVKHSKWAVHCRGVTHRILFCHLHVSTEGGEEEEEVSMGLPNVLILPREKYSRSVKFKNMNIRPEIVFSTNFFQCKDFEST